MKIGGFYAWKYRTYPKALFRRFTVFQIRLLACTVMGYDCG